MKLSSCKPYHQTFPFIHDPSLPHPLTHRLSLQTQTQHLAKNKTSQTKWGPSWPYSLLCPSAERPAGNLPWTWDWIAEETQRAQAPIISGHRNKPSHCIPSTCKDHSRVLLTQGTCSRHKHKQHTHMQCWKVFYGSHCSLDKVQKP